MLFYFKNMGDNKPKGALKLTALDSIFFDEENPSELMTLTLENDEETDTHTLEIQAETTAEAEKWIFSFQNSISDLNRLTVITEEGNESLTSSDTSKPIPGDRPATERLDVNWGKGTSKKNVGENVMSMIGLGRGKGTSIRTDSTSSSGSGGKKSDHSHSADDNVESRKKKREKLAELFKKDGGDSSKESKMKDLALFDLGWAAYSGNGGTASSGKAYIYALQHEWVPTSGSEGESTDEEETTPPV